MNYCQFRNDFIKRMANAGGGGLLPPEYQQVEYIGSTSSTLCYIDTAINNNVPIEYEVEALTYGFDDESLFGTFGRTARFFAQMRGSSSNGSRPAIGYCANFQSASSALTTRQYYKINGILHNGEQKMYIDNTLVISSSYTGTISPVIPISLFCIRETGTTRSRKFRGEMKYLKLWSNGTPIFDGIPCYRKSDNVSGFYDTVTKTLYSSLSGSNFIVGADVQ